jgi:hypothetical protein
MHVHYSGTHFSTSKNITVHVQQWMCIQLHSLQAWVETMSHNIRLKDSLGASEFPSKALPGVPYVV